MAKWHRKKRRLGVGLSVMMVLAAGFLLLRFQIPDQYLVTEENEIQGLFEMPLLEEEVLEADSQPSSNIPEGSVKVQYSLLGVIPVKEVEVTVVPKPKVYPGGMPVGIYMKNDGV